MTGDTETHSVTDVEITDASGSRSPNGQHCFSTHVAGVPIFLSDGTFNPALRIETVLAGSLLRYPNGAWHAVGWHVRVCGVPVGARVASMRIRA